MEISLKYDRNIENTWVMWLKSLSLSPPATIPINFLFDILILMMMLVIFLMLMMMISTMLSMISMMMTMIFMMITIIFMALVMMISMMITIIFVMMTMTFMIITMTKICMLTKMILMTISIMFPPWKAPQWRVRLRGLPVKRRRHLRNNSHVFFSITFPCTFYVQCTTYYRQLFLKHSRTIFQNHSTSSLFPNSVLFPISLPCQGRLC